MPRILLALLLAAGCRAAPAPPPLLPATPSPAPIPAPFVCTEVIGLTITAEWYGADFERIVPDARFQARTRPHTFVDQWADPAHAAWSEPVTSACAEHSTAPDRVVLFAANWSLKTQEDWTKVLEAFVTTATGRYPQLRELDLFTVLRGPQNQSCGDPKSVVDPMIDDAIAAVARAHPSLVHAAPKLEAPDCSVFEKGGPHFTADGRKRVAKLLARVL